MSDEREGSLRLRWIAWSMRWEIRPYALAQIVRGLGEPPELPLPLSALPPGISLRSSDLLQLTTPGATARDAAGFEGKCRAAGVSLRTPEEDDWLRRFWDELADPPPALHVKGRLHEAATPAVAIVGSRAASESGRILAFELARDLAASGVTIVSGLALGIDAAAHRGALEVEGHTVAVLAGGVDRPTPPSHQALAERIARSGALASEFPLRVHARPLHFPRRNRLIASLARIVIVVEGGKRSGARSTVEHALAIGRDVGAVPRDPLHEGSTLPNSLLRQGATPIVSAAQVLEMLEGPKRAERPREAQPGILEDPDRAVLDLLRAGPRRLEQLESALDLRQEEILGAVGRLTLVGRVVRLPGARYACAGGQP